MFKVRGTLGRVIFHKVTKLFGRCTMSPSEQETCTFVVKILAGIFVDLNSQEEKENSFTEFHPNAVKAPGTTRSQRSTQSPTQRSGPIPDGGLFSRRGERLEASSDPSMSPSPGRYKCHFWPQL